MFYIIDLQKKIKFYFNKAFIKIIETSLQKFENYKHFSNWQFAFYL